MNVYMYVGKSNKRKKNKKKKIQDNELKIIVSVNAIGYHKLLKNLLSQFCSEFVTNSITRNNNF